MDVKWAPSQSATMVCKRGQDSEIPHTDRWRDKSTEEKWAKWDGQGGGRRRAEREGGRRACAYKEGRPPNQQLVVKETGLQDSMPGNFVACTGHCCTAASSAH